MSIQDPIADMFTRIRNAQAVKKREVRVMYSKVNLALAKLLKDEGYIEEFKQDESNSYLLMIRLKYFRNKPVIAQLKRVSRPGLRIYKGKDQLPQVLDGLGIAIVSTSFGLLSDREARAKGQGGEIIAYVS